MVIAFRQFVTKVLSDALKYVFFVENYFFRLTYNLRICETIQRPSFWKSSAPFILTLLNIVSKRITKKTGHNISDQHLCQSTCGQSYFHFWPGKEWRWDPLLPFHGIIAILCVDNVVLDECECLQHVRRCDACKNTLFCPLCFPHVTKQWLQFFSLLTCILAAASRQKSSVDCVE